MKGLVVESRLKIGSSVEGCFPCVGTARTDGGSEEVLGGVGWHTLGDDAETKKGTRMVHAALCIPGNFGPLPCGEARVDSQFVERLYDGDLDARAALLKRMGWKEKGYDLRCVGPEGTA